MGSKQEFVSFIKEELKKRNWSHAELARRSGISQAHISRVLNSDYQPGLELLNSLSTSFNLPPEQLFRLANILPERTNSNQENEELIFLFSQLNQEYKNIVLDFMQILINRKN